MPVHDIRAGVLSDWFGVPNAEALLLVSLFERSGTREDVSRRTGVAMNTFGPSMARLRKAGLHIARCNRWQRTYRLDDTGRAQVQEAYDHAARLLGHAYTRWADARIAALEEALGLTNEIPPQYGLTRNEADVWRVLQVGRITPKERIHAALYGHRDDPAQFKIIDIYLHKLRRKLKPHGWVIRTVWGQGVVLEGPCLEKEPGMTSATPSYVASTSMKESPLPL